MPAAPASGTPSSPALAGTAWTLEEIQGQPVLDKSATALRFGADGRVSGGTGCNNFTGAATIAADKVTLSPLATTRRACEEGPMAQEQRFLKAIEGVQTFAMDSGGGLRLLGADGQALLRLSRAP